MGITNAFRGAVEKTDVMGLRIMMKDSLLVDPTFSEFKEMEALTRNVNGIYVPHDGRELKEDRSLWNDDYMNKLMVQVVGNFSHERVNHLQEVVRHLRPVTRPSQAAPASSSSTYRPAPRMSYQEQKRQDERDNRIIPNRGAKKAVGAVAGGIVGGAAAATVGGAIITTAGVLIGAAAGAKIVDKWL